MRAVRVCVCADIVRNLAIMKALGIDASILMSCSVEAHESASIGSDVIREVVVVVASLKVR